MANFKFYRSTPIAEGSYTIDNWGYSARMPRRKIDFIDPDTGNLFETTDTEIRKYRRNKRLTMLKNTYVPFIKSRKVSTLICVIDIDLIPDISAFLKMQKRRFKRLGLSLLAYYWQRDIGDIKFERHFHLILIFDRNNEIKLINLYKPTKWKEKVKGELCVSLKRFKEYLRGKEIYAPSRKRSYGISKHLLPPKQFK